MSCLANYCIFGNEYAVRRRASNKYSVIGDCQAYVKLASVACLLALPARVYK